MNKLHSTVLIGLMLFLSLSVIGLVAAPQPTQPPDYDYAAYSNYHGLNVAMGTDVQVWAVTNDPSVTQVTFLWHDAGGITQFGTGDVVLKSDTTPGANGYYDTATGTFYAPVHAPNSIGDWGVQCFFQGEGGTKKHDIDMVIQIRATSFNINSVPELPIIGTAGAAIAMVAGFAVFRAKRKPVMQL